jgi:hypothetical protein
VGRPGIRVALARHDFATVFKALRKVGFTQHMLADLTYQTQPQISEIMGGRRRLLTCVLIARTAEGLGVPPCLVGLRCGTCPAHGQNPDDGNTGTRALI